MTQPIVAQRARVSKKSFVLCGFAFWCGTQYGTHHTKAELMRAAREPDRLCGCVCVCVMSWAAQGHA